MNFAFAGLSQPIAEAHNHLDTVIRLCGVFAAFADPETLTKNIQTIRAEKAAAESAVQRARDAEAAQSEREPAQNQRASELDDREKGLAGREKALAARTAEHDDREAKFEAMRALCRRAFSDGTSYGFLLPRPRAFSGRAGLRRAGEPVFEPQPSGFFGVFNTERGRLWPSLLRCLGETTCPKTQTRSCRP